MPWPAIPIHWELGLSGPTGSWGSRAGPDPNPAGEPMARAAREPIMARAPYSSRGDCGIISVGSRWGRRRWPKLRRQELIIIVALIVAAIVLAALSVFAGLTY
jgi:hypothetical protein